MGFRIGGATQALANPSLGFRLDPGEPGVLRSAPASQSTLRVAEQEGRNTRRLEAAALRAGRVVTRSTRTFTRGDTGSFLGTLAGQTRVESVEPRPTPVETAQAVAEARAEGGDAPAPAPPADTGGPTVPVPAPQIEPGEAIAVGNGGSIGLFNSGFRFANPETAQVERNLVVQQGRIQRQLVQIAGVSIRLSDPEAAADVRRETAALRRQAAQIEREINRIRLAQLAVSTAQINRTLLTATETRLETTRDLVGAAAGVPGPAQPESDFLDLLA